MDSCWCLWMATGAYGWLLVPMDAYGWLLVPMDSYSRSQFLTSEPETKWMPNLDSALQLMAKCKILGQYDLPNYFYSCLKIAVF